MFYAKSIFKVHIFHFRFSNSNLLKLINAVWENHLCIVSAGAGYKQWCSRRWWVPLQHHQVQAIRSLWCHPNWRAPHIGYRWIPPIEGIWPNEDIRLNRLSWTSFGVARGDHGASNKKKRIKVSHLPIVPDDRRVSMAQYPNLILNHQRELGGSPRCSRRNH